MKKRFGMFAAGMLALVMVTGVWAYYTSTNTITNELSTKSYGNETREEFTPQDDWQPGEEVNKDVGVKNTGDYPLLVRIKFDETWTGSQTDMAIASTADNFYPADANTSGQLNAADGKTAGDGSTVFKKIVNTGTTGDTWAKGTDGYYYYSQKLAAGATTNDLLDALTLCLDTDMGIMTNKLYYTTAATEPADNAIGEDVTREWKSYTGSVPNGATFTRAVSGIGPENGYSSAAYKLNIVTEVIQATPEARTAATTQATNPWLPAFTPAV